MFKSLDIKITENELNMVLKQMDENGDGEISFEGNASRYYILLSLLFLVNVFLRVCSGDGLTVLQKIFETRS